MSLLKDLFERYKQLFFYGLFGGLTTLINLAAYYVFANLLFMPVVIATGIAWILSVLFAFFTNRIWVFESKADDHKSILKEMGLFFFSRLSTGVFDIAFMYVAVDVFNADDMLSKIISNVFIIVFNFLLSKYLVFSKAGVSE